MEGLVNMMEETVLKKIDKLWETTDGCKCQKCKLDIAAYALNRLPPRYVHSLQGKLIHRFNASTTQSDAEITSCVYQAVKKVEKNPNHPREESIYTRYYYKYFRTEYGYVTGSITGQTVVLSCVIMVKIYVVGGNKNI